MHDIDRALFEAEGDEQENPYYEGESDTYGEQETFDEGEGFDYGEGEAEEPYGEAESELDLASQLLAIQSEDELDQFLGNWINRVRRSRVGQALASHLKTAAGKVLPQIGQAIGGYIAPGTGGALGQRAGQWVSGRLGLELDGLSPEDQQFETARAFVRFANDAARAAAQAPTGVAPAVAAQKAVAAAAGRHLPGLVRPRDGATVGGTSRSARGQWVRRGKTITLLNA